MSQINSAPVDPVTGKLELISQETFAKCTNGMNLHYDKSNSWKRDLNLGHCSEGGDDRFFNYSGEVPTGLTNYDFIFDDGGGSLTVSKNNEYMGYGQPTDSESISYLSKNGNFLLLALRVGIKNPTKQIFKASFNTPFGIIVIKDDEIYYYDQDLVNSFKAKRLEEKMSNTPDKSDTMRKVLIEGIDSHYKSGMLDDLDATIMTSSTKKNSISLDSAISIANALANGNTDVVREFLEIKEK